jgi:hypothetical protein
MSPHYLSAFIAAYKEAAEWSSTHRETEDGDDERQALTRACLATGGHEWGDPEDTRSDFQVQFGASPAYEVRCIKCGYALPCNQYAGHLTYNGVPIVFSGDMIDPLA